MYGFFFFFSFVYMWWREEGERGRVCQERRMSCWRWVIIPVVSTLDFSVSTAIKRGIAVLVLLLLNIHEVWTPV